MGTCKNVCHLFVYNNYLSKFGSLMALSYNNGNQYLSDHDSTMAINIFQIMISSVTDSMLTLMHMETRRLEMQ